MNTTQNAIINACKKLNLEYEDPRGDGISIRVKINDKWHYSIYNGAFFNTSDVTIVCTDKEYTYSILKDVVKYPRYKGYLEYQSSIEHGFESELKTNESIIEDICKNFSYPLIVKMNKGSMGKNVFKCEDKGQVINAVNTIFSKPFPQDYLLIAQEYIDIKHEYRVITYKGNIEFVYEKDLSNASFNGNLSPLHWDGGKAILVEDNEIVKNIETFISPIFPIIPVTFAGLDIIQDSNGKLWFIEINRTPGFSNFLRDCGSEKLDTLMVKILSDYLQKDK